MAGEKGHKKFAKKWAGKCWNYVRQKVHDDNGRAKVIHTTEGMGGGGSEASEPEKWQQFTRETHLSLLGLLPLPKLHLAQVGLVPGRV